MNCVLSKSRMKKVMKTYYTLRKKMFDPLAWFLSRKELQNGMRAASDNVKLIFKFAEGYIGRGYYASLHSVQIPEEILELGRLVQMTKPRTILEIGTFKGGTFFMWCRSNPQAELLMSIDLPGGQYGGGYEKGRERLYREFIFDRSDAAMQLIRTDSHKESTRELVTAGLGGRNLDFLYIDGDHTYEGVRKDYELYSPLVSSGLIAFHDICHHEHGYGVDRFWKEVKTTSRMKEFIAPSSNKGIGVLIRCEGSFPA